MAKHTITRLNLLVPSLDQHLPMLVGDLLFTMAERGMWLRAYLQPCHQEGLVIKAFADEVELIHSGKLTDYLKYCLSICMKSDRISKNQADWLSGRIATRRECGRLATATNRLDFTHSCRFF